MEQHAERSEVRLQSEVKTEIAGANQGNEQVDSDEKPAISDESLSGKESNTIRPTWARC